jgi:hypothetical protein
MKIRLFLLGLSIAVILLYQLLVQLQSSAGSSHGHKGGFWIGFLIFSTLGLLLLGAVLFRLEKAFDVLKSMSAFTPHMVTTAKGVLTPKEYQKFPLGRREELSPDVLLLVFRLPTPQSILSRASNWAVCCHPCHSVQGY